MKGDSPAAMVRVAVIDPSRNDREDFKKLLAGTRYGVIGEANCGEEALERYDDWRPHLTVLHINAPGHRTGPGEGGIGIIRSLLKHDPKAHLVLFYEVETKFLRVNALKAGALSAIGKPFKRDDVIKALVAAESVRSTDVALQRSNVRLKKPLAVHYKRAADGFFTGMRTGVTEDISSSGLLLRTPEALGEKVVLKLEIELPAQSRLSARGKVMRCKPIIGSNQNNVGIAFTEIRDADADRLQAYISTQVAKGDKAF